MFNFILALPQEPARLTQGMVFETSAKVQAGTYVLPNESNEAQSAAIVIKGSGITVDFTGSSLVGSDVETPPDKRAGTAVIVEGPNITIKGLKARGYKLGLVARNCPGLKLYSCDLSYSFKKHLASTLDAEDASDWMSYHHNEKDEWLEYGAGIYLRGCSGFEVKGCRAVGGQNGLMITDCNDGLIWNNSFSFLSGIGLGMYRSSRNKVMHNNIDWCVRGYSHTKWNRGQDSAGILIYEQSSGNTFAYNSVTHGGDGFFLWAGQSTMDSGQGGCNDNLVYGNDFSHAPTNGIEATFSKNRFVNNLVMECWHGIWGGYSWSSQVVGNVFSHNAESIAWEHGQDNLVAANLFYRDRSGLVIWQKESEDPNWGYPKNHDTKSRDWRIRDNEFQDINQRATSFTRTTGVRMTENSFSDCGEVVNQTSLENLTFAGNLVWSASEASVPTKTGNGVFISPKYKPEKAYLRGDGNNIEDPYEGTEPYLDRFSIVWAPYPKDPKPNRGTPKDKFIDTYYRETRVGAPTPLDGGKRPYIKPGQLRGRRYILVDEWGPYDFKSPLLWPRTEGGGKLKLEVLGPPGDWKVVEKSGIESMSVESGKVPGYVELRLSPTAQNISLKLEYLGGDVTTPWGKFIPAGNPVSFTFTRFNLPISWDVSIYDWSSNSVENPHANMPALKDLKLGEPVKTMKLTKLDFGSGGAFVEGAPANKFCTIANGAFDVPEGEYDLKVTTDDGCRVWVDDKLVIEDAWKYQAPTEYDRTLKLGGHHTIRVEHYEIDGYSALKVNIVPHKGR